MEDKPEHVMLDEEGVVARLENEVLHEGLGDVLVRLKLTENVDEDPTVKHWLTVDRRDKVGNFLEGELNFSMILALPCICWPSKESRDCSALYKACSCGLVAGLSNIW